MRCLKIRIFKGGETSPETTCTIPTAVLQLAMKLVPKQAMAALREQGIELGEIASLASNPEVNGTLLEVEDHKKNEKVVITLE